MAKNIVTPVFCGQCNGDTNHSVKASFDYNKLPGDKNSGDAFMVIQCNGCNYVSFLHRAFIPTTKGDYFDFQYPENYKTFDLTRFLSNKEQLELPDMISGLYAEVINAFYLSSAILGGLGLRTLVEALCIQQQIPGRNLMDKIKNLQVQGLISAAELPILDKLRLIGNSSAHEIKSMPMEVLEYAVQIINHVLKSVYILPNLNKKIKL